MRERLIEVISKASLGNTGIGHNPQMIADALIEAGVIFNPETDIRPKFKVGQEVWHIKNLRIKPILEKCRIYSIDILNDKGDIGYCVKFNPLTRPMAVFTSELFATEAEALAALEKESKQ